MARKSKPRFDPNVFLATVNGGSLHPTAFINLRS